MNEQVLFCNHCKKEKSISEFYKYRLHQCKNCVIIKQKKYYKNNRERIRKYIRDWQRKNPDEIKEARKKRAEKHFETQAEYYRNWYKVNGRKRAKDYLEYIRLWGKRNPEAIVAHKLTKYAVKLGILKKLSRCEFCKKRRKTLGHHEDYSKPLEVKWICYSCHAKLNFKKSP